MIYMVAWLIYFAVVLFVVGEVTHMIVFGKILSEKKLDAFFANGRITKYTLNTFSKNGKLLFGMEEPYIAIVYNFLTKWVIRGHGSIPRWSKWQIVLDEHRKELMQEREDEEDKMIANKLKNLHKT